MKFASILVILFATVAALAGPHSDSGRFMQPLIDELALDDYQAGQVEEILAAAHERKRELHRERSEGAREQMQAMHAEVVEQLRQVLSEDQVQQFIEFTEERRGRHHFRHHEDPHHDHDDAVDGDDQT